MPGPNGKYRWWILANTTFVNLVGGGIAWFYVVVVFREVMADLDLEVSSWGALWSGISLGGLALSIPAGALGDRFGVRRIVTLGLAVNGASLLLRASAGGFISMLVSMVLFGVSLALIFANLPKTLGVWFPSRELGLANGVNLAGLGVGQGIGTLITPHVVGPLGGWRSLTSILGYAVLVLAVGWLVAVREAPTGSPGKTSPGRVAASIRQVLRVRDVWLLAVCYLLFMGGLLSAIVYLPIYFATVQGMSGEAAGAILSLAPWSFIIGSTLLPTLSDRMGLRKVVYVVAIIVTGGAVFAQASLVGMPLALASVIWGLSGGAVGLIFVVPVETRGVKPELVGTAFGLITSAGFLGGALLPIVGMAVAEIRPLMGFAFFSACYLVSALLFGAIRETGARRHASGS